MFDNEVKKTRFVLWNTSNNQLETRYNGRFVMFAPGEKKSFGDRDDVLNHVHAKLGRYGVVKLKEGSDQEDVRKALITGLKERHKTLRFVIEQFQSANKAREAKMMAPEMPSERVSDAVVEDQAILDKLKDLDEEKTKLVQDYFKNIEKRESEVLEVVNNNDTVKVTATGAVIEKKRPGRPRKQENDLPLTQVAGVS